MPWMNRILSRFPIGRLLLLLLPSRFFDTLRDKGPALILRLFIQIGAASAELAGHVSITILLKQKAESLACDKSRPTQHHIDSHLLLTGVAMTKQTNKKNWL